MAVPDPDFPTLETPRLQLREIVPADAPALFAVHGDPASMRWFGNDPVPDLAAVAKLVDVFASWRRQPNPGTRWGIQPKGQTELVGSCGLFAWNRAWRKCTLGYELNASARGQGLMHEALQACLAWGFEHMQLNRVEALVHPQNAASLRSVERLGFVREGLLRQAGYWGGQHHDMLQFGLLRDAWIAPPRFHSGQAVQ
jgi:ribosomal-protein-alanine N-acetyltransferase